MSSNSVTLTAREHVFPLFVKYVSANVLGMIGYSCYILADTFFVARGIGSDAIAALNLVLPAFSLLNGTGLMIGLAWVLLRDTRFPPAELTVRFTARSSPRHFSLHWPLCCSFSASDCFLQDLSASYSEQMELHCRMRFHTSASCLCSLRCFCATIC